MAETLTSHKILPQLVRFQESQDSMKRMPIITTNTTTSIETIFNYTKSYDKKAEIN